MNYLLINIVLLLRIKMSCASIRVECYHLPINKSISNEKLGYVLLKIKGAQTVNPESNERVSYFDSVLISFI